MELPAGVTARPMSAALGAALVDDSGDPVKLVWQRDSSAVGASDTLFYQVSFRFTAPGTPLTALAFRTTQYCAGGTQLVWEGVDAPTLQIVPVHVNGWNKYTAQADITLAEIAIDLRQSAPDRLPGSTRCRRSCGIASTPRCRSGCRRSCAASRPATEA